MVATTPGDLLVEVPETRADRFREFCRRNPTRNGSGFSMQIGP